LASSGSNRSTGSSSLNLPSSMSIITAAAVTALVCEAIRKIVSRRMSLPAPNAILPSATVSTKGP
jgi:hypothetical protein